MTTISVHGLDDAVEKELRRRAQKNGQSLNKTVKDVLEQALAPSRRTGRNRQRFERFCGVWSQREHDEFMKNTKAFEEVDPKDWE